MKTNGKTSQSKVKRGVSFVARVNKTKTVKALTALLATASKFPCANPVTHRRRKRAIVAKFNELGVNVRVSGNFGIVTLA